jgi:CheY-like chemotaxis protein
VSTTNRLLVVEDSEAKLASIVSALRAVFPDFAVDCAMSVKAAMTALRTWNFSLVVADMSLPTYDVKLRERGGTARPFGGIEVFDYLKRRKMITPVIVVSSYPAIIDGGTSLTLPDLASRLRSGYGHIFAGYVFFDSAYLTWELELQSLAKEAIYGSRPA